MKLFTIGFTKTSAEEFFSRLQSAEVRRIVDVRLNNTSQLAGFAKSRDLKYFLKAIGDIDYIHFPLLAPTQDILDEYKKNKGSWAEFEKRFKQLLEYRKITETMHGKLRDGDCLLCSEHTPEYCHRRLIVELIRKKWGNMEVLHL